MEYINGRISKETYLNASPDEQKAMTFDMLSSLSRGIKELRDELSQEMKELREELKEFQQKKILRQNMFSFLGGLLGGILFWIAVGSGKFFALLKSLLH